MCLYIYTLIGNLFTLIEAVVGLLTALRAALELLTALRAALYEKAQRELSPLLSEDRAHILGGRQRAIEDQGLCTQLSSPRRATNQL